MKSLLKSLYQYSRNNEIKELIFEVFSENFFIRSYAAENKNAPVFILEYLSNDANRYVRISVAGNPRTPKSILDKLSNDNDETVCYWVSRNPNWINKNIKK